MKMMKQNKIKLKKKFESTRVFISTFGVTIKVSSLPSLVVKDCAFRGLVICDHGFNSNPSLLFFFLTQRTKTTSFCDMEL